MTDKLTRIEEIAHRVRHRHQVAFTTTDPVYHASITKFIDMLIANESALAEEGVTEETRERVTYRLIYDEAPPTYPVPDSREALARLRARCAQMWP